ncbi:MAG TPA: glutamate--tRNA ligase [Candidatus Saccharimonadales bacterium]|nr:glutamate--tRNA ligase [Candidatus Saccharimonadales bacterium]
MKYGEGMPQPATPPGAKSTGGVAGPADKQSAAVRGPVRTRFAPSPTGYLHVGGIRTALFAWLLARQAGNDGQFILRLEDTDKNREVTGADEHIMKSLKALGLNYDEGPDIGGPFGPYRQSERLDIYRKWAEKLIKKGRAYADPYSPIEVQAFREQAQKEKRPFLYRDRRPENPPRWDGSQPLRFKSEPKAYVWHDEVMGDLSTGPEVIDDFILIKSDGYPTYNFAHIIDDLEMQISHVIRGQEFLASMPNYLNLYEALGIERPVLATMPHILGPDGNKKLSKRDGAKDVLDYIREGYLPDALVNFIASLGWNDGTEQEIFSRNELTEKFRLDHVQRSGARFDERRLTWMNGHYIRELSLKELAERAADFWPAKAKAADETYKNAILGLVQERLKYFAELPELTRFFFEEPDTSNVKELYKNPVDKQLKKIEFSDYKPMLDKVITKLENSDFSEDNITNSLNQLLEELGTKPGVLFALVRIALTGQTSSPQIFGTLHVLGQEKSINRLKKAAETLAN